MRYKEEEKAKRLENWQQSGKSAWVYAKENRFNYKTLKNWISLETETKQSFVEVPSNPVRQHIFQQPAQILIEKGDMKIHIPLCVSKNELSCVLESLAASIW